MSKRESAELAGRALAVLLLVWALAEIANLPGYVQSYLYYSSHANASPSNLDYWQYWRHHYLIDMSFVVAKIVGFALMARWLFKGGNEVAELLLPSVEENIVVSPDK